MRWPHFAFIAVVSIAVLGLVSCTSVTAVPAAVSGGPSAFTAAGPWAQEFADASAQANAYQRRILADGVITAAERSDAQARMSGCMRGLGHRWKTFDDGTSESDPLTPRAAQEDVETVASHMRACGKRYDQDITYLYNEVRRNPQKQDEAKITVACLQQTGLVGKDYTERKWRADNDTGVWPFNDYDPRAVQCRLDPLGLWRDQ